MAKTIESHATFRPEFNNKSKNFQYSKKYYDENFEYRHIKVPNNVLYVLPKPPILLSTIDMEKIGLKLSDGWVNYLRHKPEPHILLVRRSLTSKEKLNRSLNPGKFPSFLEIDKKVWVDKMTDKINRK